MSKVFWITGLSGSGKTTIATELVKRLRERQLPVVFLDGDLLREVLGKTNSHDVDSRRAISLVYAKLCKMLAEQGLYVVCATISLFHSTQAWNRTHIAGYIEVWVDVSLEALRTRNSKQIYSMHNEGRLPDVMGVDIVAEFPKNPDVIIYNENGANIDHHIEAILKKALIKRNGRL